MVFDDGWLVELRGSRRDRLMPAADAPATLLGLARHNVANALAAAAAARAMGLERDAVAAGLRAFRPTAEQAPGRVNLYRMGNRLVIIDFAHNEAGIRVVLDLAEAICGPRARRRRLLTVIVGAAGDRPDDTLRGIGRAAAQRADRLAIKETRKYLRGRSPEAVIGEILAGMVQGGARRSRVPVYEDEQAALRAMATDPAAGIQADSRERARKSTSARPRRPADHSGSGRAAPADKSGEVIVLAVHEDRAGVRATLDELGAAPIEATDLAELVRIGDRAAVR
jgi:cyanophycin synthetase